MKRPNIRRKKSPEQAEKTNEFPNNVRYRGVQGVFFLVLAAVAALFIWRTVFSQRDMRVANLQDHAKIEAKRSTSAQSNTALAIERGYIPVDRGQTWNEIDNPSQDGWDSEQFHEQIKEQLKKLGKLISHPNDLSASDVGAIAHPTFQCLSLAPARWEPCFQDDALCVERAYQSQSPNRSQNSSASESEKGGEEPGFDESGPGRLAAALRELSASFENGPETRCEFKVVRIERKEDGSIESHQHVAISGKARNRRIEQHAVWTAEWNSPSSTTTSEPGWTQISEKSAYSGSPQLLKLRADEFERTTTLASAEPLFVDRTAIVLGDCPSFQEQVIPGLNHWLERTQDMRYFPLLGAAGIAVADVNGDGRDDVYFCQELGLPNRLFLQNPDGTARDVSEASGANWLDATRSALFADLDNDGDQDLIAAVVGALVIAANDGQGRFDVRQVLPTKDDVMSLTAADYNRDGRLDLYVCANFADDWVGNARGHSMAVASVGFVYHDANNGGRNALFRNEGGFQFADVTEAVGLDVNNRRYSLAAAWEDFDNDGDQDLYVANDYGRNNLYRNDSIPGVREQFTDVAAEAGAEDSASGMSVSWADVNHDGWSDLYVGNMFSSAGNRIMYQRNFKPESSPTVRSRLQRFARGNTLLISRRDATFSDVSEAASVTLGRWAWGSNFVDVNNDGWEDLVVANGYITTEDSGDL